MERAADYVGYGSVLRPRLQGQGKPPPSLMLPVTMTTNQYLRGSELHLAAVRLALHASYENPPKIYTSHCHAANADATVASVAAAAAVLSFM